MAGGIRARRRRAVKIAALHPVAPPPRLLTLPGAHRGGRAECQRLPGRGLTQRACVGDNHGGVALGPPLRPGGRTSRIMNTKCVMVAKGDVAANRGTWSISWAGGASFARLRVLMASRA